MVLWAERWGRIADARLSQLHLDLQADRPRLLALQVDFLPFVVLRWA